MSASFASQRKVFVCCLTGPVGGMGGGGLDGGGAAYSLSENPEALLMLLNLFGLYCAVAGTYWRPSARQVTITDPKDMEHLPNMGRILLQLTLSQHPEWSRLRPFDS